MRNKFDMQLDSLKEQLTTMGELCEVAITKATEAILEGKEEQAREVIQADEEIDQAEKDIERLCLRLLLQQQPVEGSTPDFSGSEDDYGYGTYRRSGFRYRRDSAFHRSESGKKQ